MRKVILDTDLGTDVDDVLALALILGSPELALLGVTTVYGNTLQRARLTQRVAGIAGHRVEVYPGARETLSGRAVWWPGHEGTLHPDLEREAVHPEDSAVDFLVDTVLANPGEIDVIAIGPLTNIALAIRKDPRFVANVRHLWVMGGSFNETRAEHNLRCDAVAADIVFSSGIEATVTGLEITRRVEFREPQLQTLGASGELGRILEADIRQWWALWDEDWNHPHDPTAVLTLIRPELFGFSEPGRITIRPVDDVDSEQAGWSSFSAQEGGSVRITDDVDPEAVRDEIVARVIQSASRGE